MERSTGEFEERIASLASLLNSWLGYYGATEEASQIDQVRLQTEDALRFSEWRRWANAATRQRGLLARGVESELAQQAAHAGEDGPVIREALLKAYPSEYFRNCGLGSALPGKAASPTSLDYSGRLCAQAGPDGEANELWRPTRLGDSNWPLFSSRWLGVSLQLARCRQAFLPRVVSLSFESRGHRIVILW